MVAVILTVEVLFLLNVQLNAGVYTYTTMIWNGQYLAYTNQADSTCSVDMTHAPCGFARIACFSVMYHIELATS